MTPKDLNELKKALSITSLKDDIRKLDEKIEKINDKLSSFWFKVSITVIASLITSVIIGKIL